MIGVVTTVRVWIRRTLCNLFGHPLPVRLPLTGAWACPRCWRVVAKAPATTGITGIEYYFKRNAS